MIVLCIQLYWHTTGTVPGFEPHSTVRYSTVHSAVEWRVVDTWSVRCMGDF